MFTRAVLGSVLVSSIVGLTMGRTDHPTDRGEFRVVVASELEGEWATDNFTDEKGMVITGANGGGPVLTVWFEGDRYAIRGWMRNEGSYVVKGAGAIDLRCEREAKKVQGIFKVEGDTLLLCYGKERPTSFEFKPGRCFMVLKRVKP
jgi:uncharacterized protein (TIGR03067 family)